MFDGSDRSRRLDGAFEELRIDVKGKRVLDVREAASDESSPGDRFDVIVSSLPSRSSVADAEAFDALRSQLLPGGVLCVFVPVADHEEHPREALARRESPVWSVAGAVSAAGFHVLFAEGATSLTPRFERPATWTPRKGFAMVSALMRRVVRAFVPRTIATRAARWLDRAGVCPMRALVVARKAA